MSATGLDVFDKTINTTNIWLDEIADELGPDRQQAWHVLGIVLRIVRDRLPVELAAHLSAELPLLVRGTFYDQFRPETQPQKDLDGTDAVYERILHEMRFSRPVNPKDATQAVFRVLNRHLARGLVEHVRDSLPRDLRALWQNLDEAPSRAARGGGEEARPSF